MARSTATEVLPIQTAVANASPGQWRDGLVSVVGDGIVEVIRLDGSVRTVITGASVAVGDPVSLHAVAEILAAGQHRWAARAAS